ncbi:PREDICTED: uncharacterized protein LOC105451590 [Wasmannia auropunctata]|uniref:uncharacterized protein LOC105451590 n=1 Tax=Wasmannia auropunctata TaxID=64793 RepID=UPI0005EEEE85|nr:PREDICTED: uncharacterized protein LOC105451590 [Wasmannia auropunctata]
MANMNTDPILQAWLTKALDMVSSRKRSRLVVEICDKHDYVPMLKRIEYSEATEEYLELAKRFGAAVKDVLAGADDSSVAGAYRLDLETLRGEVHRHRDSGAEQYEFPNGKTFSYKEELMLLEILATVPQAYCVCQKCTSERLPYVALYVARQKNKVYPHDWNEYQQASKEWVENFITSYEDEFLRAFPFPSECKSTQAMQGNSSEDSEV